MNRRSRIFLSHAGSESQIAQRVADRLNQEGLEPVLDREKLEVGLSFISFMENALSTSDFCLLLWSAAAATRKWVDLEWQSALYRSVDEARAFLAVGRIDGHPLPALLKPRLYVDLHPQLDPGLGTLVRTWQDDRAAEDQSQKPVGSMQLAAPATESGEPIYLTSDLFGITVPWRVDLEAPAGLLLDEVQRSAQLPSLLTDPRGRTGIRYDYTLMLEERALERGKSLADQGVRIKGVLWIRSQLTPFAVAQPQSGALTGAVFRGRKKSRGRAQEGEDSDFLREARQHLLSQVEKAGLGAGARK